jgi:hypothetical protein
VKELSDENQKECHEISVMLDFKILKHFVEMFSMPWYQKFDLM